MNRKGFTKGAFLVATVILILIMLYSGLQLLESTVLLKGGVPSETRVSKTVVYEGKEYYPRQDITVVMLLGIDEEGPVVESATYNNSGGADMVTLLIFDPKTQQCDLLVLNRDAMVEMPVLGVTGRPAGTLYGQLALSHTYGSGLEDSCENTRTTVSDLLCGAQIDYYFSMNMDGIGILNDAIGGVEVTVRDDFSQVDPTLTQGATLRLNAWQAQNFVRSRQGVGNGLNISRMERQKQYMQGFVSMLKAHLEENPLYASQLLAEVDAYTVTDCSPAVLNRLATDYGDYTLGRIISPEGENVLGEKYYEFYLDEKALEKLAIELFFEEKP